MGWFRKKPAAARQDPRNAEYETLAPQQKQRVDAVVDKVREAGKQVNEQHGGADYYAYPHASGGTSWGIDDPINIKRGVKPK
jgi:predicted transglutaminase-like cysteine proteinase